MAVRHLCAVAFVLVAARAEAVVRGGGVSDTLVAQPAAGVTKPLRVQPRVRFGAASPPASWHAFVQAAGGAWEVAWDAATGAPMRIWGSGIAAPGANAHADVAEAVARRTLADHIALLAPGAAPTDFQLVSNTSDGEIRSIGFVQLSGGKRVVGGHVSFLFKRDRLFVIGSQALPNVPRLSAPSMRIAPAALHAATSLGPDVILPLVGDDAVLAYRLVAPYEVHDPAHYLAYTDPASGQVVAQRSLDSYATGTLLYRTPDRYPGRGFQNLPAPLVTVQINGANQTTTPVGGITWSPDAATNLTTSTAGTLAIIVNKAMNGTLAFAMLPIDPGGQTLWDATGTPEDEAQVDAYLSVNIAKDFVRRTLDPMMLTLDDQMTINVNIAQDCNAFFDGKNLNFFHATTMCENTARIQDVVFHEYGHRVHSAEIIDGVGAFDSAMSEGVADFLAASITGDHGMGRGFFYNDTPLRDLDPDNMEYRWPDDIGEIHHTGLIFGSTFWDLRKALIASLGQTAGIAQTEKLYLGVIRRSINIPTTLIEALATDDDDGDLSNGTPHECAIRDAFGRHGLRTASGNVTAPGAIDTNAKAIQVVADVTGLSTRCTGDVLTDATLIWVPGFSGLPAGGSAPAVRSGQTTFYAELPLSTQDDVAYKVKIGFQDGSSMQLADNLADPYYQLYQGRTVKLYCTDFETDPFAEGWATGTDDGSPSPWEWGVPTGGATDPPNAYSGTHVLAQALNGDYAPKQHSWVTMPEIDVGAYSDVRVQYRRWLSVEDAHFDQARVLANDARAWQNFDSNKGDSSQTQHIDREWRFHDVPVSGAIRGRKLVVAWDLKSDAGLELGGWTLDDVCVVANPYALCGDGARTNAEQCDDGAQNADKPDACRTDCRLPSCGDRIVDSKEECDDGPEGSPSCTAKCLVINAGTGGCCSASGGASGSLALAVLVGGLVFRRRRQLTRTC